jgi:hypothetical protein
MAVPSKSQLLNADAELAGEGAQMAPPRDGYPLFPSPHCALADPNAMSQGSQREGHGRESGAILPELAEGSRGHSLRVAVNPGLTKLDLQCVSGAICSQHRSFIFRTHRRGCRRESWL